MGTAGARAGRVEASEPKEVWRDLPWYLAYCAYHLLLLPVLACVGLARFRREKLRGIGWRRLIGGTPPSGEGPWLILVAGALGETRTALNAARSLSSHIKTAVWLQQAKPYQVALDAVAGVPVGLAPLNNPLSALVAVLRWRPQALIFVEGTSNLHLMMVARLLGIPAVIANVSLTEYRMHKYLARPFGAKRFQIADRVLAQGEEHRARLERLGVRSDRISVTGPPIPLLQDEEERSRSIEEWRERLGVRDRDLLVVAGSTYPEEEPALLEAFALVKQRRPDARLVLAPRHTSGDSVDDVLKRSGFEYERRSLLNGKPASADVVLLDTQGELGRVWGVATVAFVGGSLFPGGPGHSPLEPLSWCVPVTIGPEYQQQVAAVGLCREWGVVRICEEPSALAEEWLRAAEDREYRLAFRERCEAFIQAGQDVYQRWWESLFHTP
jgi:3-deoxy-D-manno-octulosonic-acid transferase